MNTHKKFDIIFRADGDSKIGMGHIFRTLNLAKILQQKNLKILFLTSNKLTQKIIKENGFMCKIIPLKVIEQKEFLKLFFSNIVILDKKYEKTSIIKQFKKISNLLFAIDYIGKNKDQIPFGLNILYSKSGSKSFFSGFEYAILNSGFKKTKKISKSVKSILILQGGADTNCFIPKIIDALDQSSNIFSITAIVGHSFDCWKELENSKINCKKNLKILKNISNMHIEMLNHDIAISAGGMTSLELAKSGIPSIFLGSEKQEEETSIMLEKCGFGVNLGFSKKFPKTLSSQIDFLIQNYSLRRTMNKIGPKLVDGKGSLRVKKLLSQVQKKNYNFL